MRERIRRTRTFSAGAYASPEAFIEDLTVLRDQLVAASAEALPNDDLLDLIFRVRCFGFHLASVEVREDARVHRRVVGELLGDPQYPDRSDAERRAALEELRLPQRLSDVSDEARRLLSLFDTFRRLQARFGERAIHTYIMSMAQSAADVFEVKRLAELHGCGSSVDIVPLLETRSALENASTLLEELLSDDAYRNHLEGRRCEQELLVGYSDSMKESGVLASRALVLEAQRAASRVAKDAGIALRIFHGRGGSVSRGGGPTHRAIRALPGDAFSGQMKITEQGETRAFHFGNPDLAVRYLEQSLGAALITRTTARSGQLQRPKDEADLLPQLADTSARAYRRLVEDEGTLEYFRQATPLAQIGSLNIASRPARRGQGRPGLDDLRAIPWVFAWSQARHVITGWFGVGTALESVLAEEDGLARLQRLYEQSPFFFDLLDNVQMTLAKTDLPIASRYAELCRDAAIRDRVFGAIRDEHDRTVDAVLRVTGQSALLDEDPVVKRSIRLRNPYVDPLSYLQVEALRRLQDEAEEQARPPRGSVPPSAADGGWERVARVAVQGISAGLRNTG
jgi:phosphoenolpyruvate carboxylase